MEVSFNQQLRDRTMAFAVGVHDLLQSRKVNLLIRPMVNQVMRSSSSVAANYRAATRARSDAEYYAKICIVTEEIDESQFWLEYLMKIRFISGPESSSIRSEADELVRLFTAIKKKLKDKLQNGHRQTGNT